jgi:parvulin-like peptidyl-prolyl isomerase
VVRRAFLAAAAAAVLGCKRGAPPREPAAGRPPVARVNAEPLSREALRRELPPDGDRAAVDEGALRAALDAALTRAVLAQEARARGVAASDAEVAQALAAVRAEYPGAAFDELLAKQRATVADVEARLREQLAIERLVAGAVAAAPPSDEELRRWFDAHGAELARGDEVRARQIVTRTREEAERARAEAARDPSRFADVARRLSVAPEANAGGDLGWFGKGSGMPEVFERCFALPTGAVSPVAESPYGFHVFQVTHRRAAAAPSFDAVRGEIAARLERERRARAEEEFVAQLRAKAKIEVDEAALAAALREAP